MSGGSVTAFVPKAGAGPSPWRAACGRSVFSGFVALGAAILVAAERKEHTSTVSAVAWSGTATFAFDIEVLESLGWDLSARGSQDAADASGLITFPLADSPPVEVQAVAMGPSEVFTGVVNLYGGILIADGASDVGIGNLAIGRNPDGRWVAISTMDGPAGSFVVFELEDVVQDNTGSRLALAAHLVIASSLAERMNAPHAAGSSMGSLWIDAERSQFPAAGAPSEITDGGEVPGHAVAGAIGPDVIVGDLWGGYDAPNMLSRYGTENGITGYAVGTTSCNVGDQRLKWFAGTPEHPVIAQNFYRLKDGRFEQIGLSWLKHGFYALSQNLCRSPGCNVTDGTYLGVGCSDPYDAPLNGNQNMLGPRHQVNPKTGVFAYPPTRPLCNPALPQNPGPICRRLQVHDVDLDPKLNRGARYFVEGHYITQDDAAAGNGNNNASYRRCTVTEVDGAPGVYNINVVEATQRQKAALIAWRDTDPSARVVFVDVPGEGRFLFGFKASPLGGGWWHYEYAVQNLNSDRAAGFFDVPLLPKVAIDAVGFHDVEDHSGSPYGTADWTAEDLPGESTRVLHWSTTPHAINANANALRWGSLYNFRFDANAPPTVGVITLGLFKPGDPAFMEAVAAIPGGPVEIVAGNPPHGAIDARQPTELDGSRPAGWHRFELTLNVLVNGMLASDFEVEQVGGATEPPQVIGILPNGDKSLSLFLTSAIAVGARTRIMHAGSGSTLEVSSLPGDVSGNGTSDPADVMALVEELDGMIDLLPDWSIDIDRSEALNPQDLARLIDLLMGANAFDPHNGVSLPSP